MQTLTVSGFGTRFSLKSGCVRVYQGDDVIAEKSLRDISEIIVGKKGVSISSDLLAACAEQGINIAFLDYSGKPYGLFNSPLINRTVATRRKQFEALNKEEGVDIAKAIIVNKIANQINLLRYFSKSSSGTQISSLRESAEEMRVYYGRAKALTSKRLSVRLRDLLMGIEGKAAAIYWNCISGFISIENFTNRSGRHASDVVNAYLNYGYGILYAKVWGALTVAGLEPFAGFLHTDRPGKYALVLDMVEEFRVPVVDRPVIAHFSKKHQEVLGKDGWLNQEQRKSISSSVASSLERTHRYKKRNEKLLNIIGQQAFSLARHFRGEDIYKPFRAIL